MLQKGHITSFLVSFLFLATSAFAAPQAVVQSNESFAVSDVAVSSDGATVAAALGDGSIRLFGADSGMQQGENISLPAAISDIGFAGSAHILAAAKSFFLIDINNRKLTKADGLSTVQAVAADSGGNMAVAASGKTLHLFPLPAFQQSASINTAAEILSVVVHGATRQVYAAGRDGFMRCYSYSGELCGQYKAEGAITSLAISADRLIFTAGESIYLADVSLKNVDIFSRHAKPIRSVAITPDGRFAASGGDDAFVSWDLQTKHSELTPIANVNAAGLDPYFRYIVAGTDENGSGELIIQYTADRGTRRSIYAFRDATLTLSPSGYADGIGLFGKYLSYNDNGKIFSFQEVASVVHKPEKLIFPLKVPKVAQIETSASSPQGYIDTEPPTITLFERGFALSDSSDTVVINGSITDDSGVAWARADYKPLSLSAEGQFSLETSPSAEGKTIIISAADSHGNAADRAVYVQGKNAAEGNGKKYALLIGINQYEALPGLATAEFGARSLAELFKVYGYEPILLLGAKATREGIFTEVNRLRRELANGDKLIIYYAGHGFLDSTTGAAYWQGYDARPNDDTRWVDTAQLARNINASGCDFLLIADSCFAGATERGLFKGHAAFISGGGVEPVADVGLGGHSIFTGATIRAMRKAEFADSKSFFDAIIKEFPADAAQSPEYFSPLGFDF